MSNTKLERDFQRDLIKELETIFPGCVVLKNDPELRQGIPDLLLLWGKHWAALEVKRTIFAKFQPNQEWYLDHLDNMSYAAMICPENKELVIHDLQQAFGA